LALGGFGLFVYARAHRQDSIASPAVPLDTPPADLPPALVGKLTEQSQGFMGTLFDLAQRGVLEVHEGQGHWGSKKYTLELKKAAASLNAHEQGLLSAIFKPGEATVDLSAVSTRLASKHKVFDEPLEQELLDRGWLDPDRKRQRRHLGVMSFLLLMGSLGMFMLGMIGAGVGLAAAVTQAPWWAAVIGLAVGGFVIVFGLVIYALTYSPLTPAGEAEAVGWKSFARYLKQISKRQQPDPAPEYFERYLPLAVVFGLGGEWAKHFQSVGGAPLPVWFQAMPGNDGDFSAIIAVMVASDSAASAGGSNGGASGGGASGAG
jgi:uncharacterized protein (TIGR04222 family)